MRSLFRYYWVVLFVIQLGAVVYFMHDMQHHGLYNTDAFSYHIQWSKVASTFNPFSEAVVADPGHDLVRVPFSMPHFFIGITACTFNPEVAYLIWSCVGLLSTYFSLMFFARALGFKPEHAHLAALIHYSFFHILSQLPPLSGNQLRYILDCFLIAPENVEHFGPRQYPHDMFFYPLLYTILALTLFGVKKIKAGEWFNPVYVWLWVGLCWLLPFNYFYHWFQYAFSLCGIVAAGFVLRWWKVDVVKQYPQIGFAFCAVLIGWGGVVFFQNAQLTDVEGYRFALMGGLTEARFFLLPTGLVIRIVLWSAVALLVLRLQPNSVLLVIFLSGCLVLMNMQIVVGKNIQPGHWSFGVDRVYAWIAILLGVEAARRFGRSWLPKLLPVIALGSFLFFTAQTIVSWKHFETLSRWDEERDEVISFLKSQPVGVVLAPELWLETDILIHTPHYSFIPRAAQSAVSAEEQLQRVSQAAFILGYSREGFLKWLHIRSVRFFGMLYGTEKEFSSTYFYDPAKRKEVLDFKTGSLPSWDWEMVEKYKTSTVMLDKKLDLIVLHVEEAKPAAVGEVVFKNDRYVIYKAAHLFSKSWGEAVPSAEKRYALGSNP